MDIIKYIILGILQGITEPLPISSSGHIYIIKAILNTDILSDLSLEIFLNFASFIAILLIFRKDVWSLIKGFFTYLSTKGKECKEEFKYCWLLVLGTIPVGILGLTAKDAMETLLSKNIFLVGIGFAVTAIALLLVMRTNGTKKDKDITIKDAIVIGLYQAIAIVPGISRSGMTLVGSLLSGLENKTALKYSFMLYLPVSVATMLTGISEVAAQTMDFNHILFYAAGMLGAGIFTYVSYNWLSKIVEKGKLWRFSLYLFAVALFTIMLFI